MKSSLKDFRKVSLKQRLPAFYVTIFFFFVCLHQLSAQDAYQNQLSINVNNTSIENVLTLIENESSYHFVYKSDLKGVQQKVSLNIKSFGIKELLNEVFKGTMLTYTMMDNNLIVVNEVVTDKNRFAGDDRIITGRVTGDGGVPLAGVSVQIKGTNNGVTTNSNGVYSINVADSDVLVFSYVGYETQELSVTGKETLDVALVSHHEDLTQVIVVGYGTQRKIDVTGSVSHVNGSEISKQPVLTATQAIQGQVAGVQVSSSGQPGSAPQVIIRGAGSILAGVGPLYVVDGVPLPGITTTTNGTDITNGSGIANINTADILSIDVLKDASACAIYGARAANGVVLITTRQGSGKMKINYSVDVGISQAANLLQMANASQYLNYRTNITGLPIAATGYNTNWYSEVLRTALYQNNNITVSGSGQNDKYLFGASYLTQQGIIIANDFSRYTIRFNNEFTPASFIKIGTTISYANNISQNPPNVTNNLTEDAYRAAPTVPAIVNGKYGNTSAYQDVGNPVLDAYSTDNLSHSNTVQGSAYLQINPVKSLTLKSTFGGEIIFYDDRQYTYEHPNDSTFFFYVPGTTSGTQGQSRSSLGTTNVKTYDWTWDNTANFNKSFGKNKLDITAGISAEKYATSGIALTVYDVPVAPSEWYPQDGDLNTAVLTPVIPDEITRVGYLGRIFYSYDNRFLLTANFRTDGSSVFQYNKWGYFPGISGGWVITKEKFMQNQHFFQNLKLRAGWGELGNSNIQSDASYSLVYSPLPYFFNSGTSGGISGATIGTTSLQVKDQNLKWEVTDETDLGLEYTILNGKLDGEFDVYDKRVNNALIYAYVPGTFGSQADPASTISPGYVLSNAAVIDNKGLEISLHWHDNIKKDLSYSIGGNVSFNKNDVLSLNGGVPFADGNINGYFVTETKPGYPVGSFFVSQVVGVTQTGPNAGDFIYKTNTNGAPDTVYAGSYQPKAYMGLSGSINYKSFDFSVNLYANIGNQVYNGKDQARTVATDNIEASIAENYWTPQNHSETQPAPNGGNLPASTYFVSSGTFARINNIGLGYTMPASILSKQKVISSCRFFITAQNPVTLKKYSGFSSELPGSDATNAGIDLNTYPTTKTFAVGVNLGL